MADYRRNRVPGGTCFFTANLHERGSDLLIRHIAELRSAIQAARAAQPFHIDAWVVLPDHTHCLWTLPPGDSDYPKRWQTLKSRFPNRYPPSTQASHKTRRRERGIWQRRSWEHTVRNARDDTAHMDYIHFNPVKHGLAQHPIDWPFSTFRRCVAAGLYPANWSAPERHHDRQR